MTERISSSSASITRADLGITIPERPLRRVPEQGAPARTPMANPPTKTPMAAPPTTRPVASVDVDAGRAEKRRRELAQLQRALGPLLKALEDPTVTDIHRNADGGLWLVRLGTGTEPFPNGFKLDDDTAMQIIAYVSNTMKAEISQDHARLFGVLPIDGSRFTGMVPPLVSAPFFTIRKHAVLVRTFEHYLEQKIMTTEQVQFLRKRIHARDNILIVGATGSGKTTFANAILREAAESSTPSDRVIIIEDVRELQCPAPNKEFFLTDEARGIDMEALLATALRCYPKRICIGELRGKEAATFIEACNTGHKGGLATIHSDTVENGLIRLETLIRKANREPSKSEIASAIHTIVSIEYNEMLGRRRVTAIKRMTGANENQYYLSDK